MQCGMHSVCLHAAALSACMPPALHKACMQGCSLHCIQFRLHLAWDDCSPTLVQTIYFICNFSPGGEVKNPCPLFRAEIQVSNSDGLTHAIGGRHPNKSIPIEYSFTEYGMKIVVWEFHPLKTLTSANARRVALPMTRSGNVVWGYYPLLPREERHNEC